MNRKRKNPTELRFVYITTGSREEAKRIGSILVTSHLAACANIFDRMNSIYFWDGKLQDDTETVLIIKTTRGNLKKVFETVKQHHSYQIPCMISLPIREGYEPFLTWIKDEVTCGE
ncbi:MAG: divalent-cation tolerance protein CutA [Thermodesulfobacteriota bacterium]